MKETRIYHRPVMVDEVLEYIITRPDGEYVDATAGGGSHSSAIAQRLDESGRLLAIDKDADAIAEARDKLREFGSRISIKHGEFSHLKELVAGAGFNRVSGILFDLGVSSHQLDSADRGFSYLQEGPLDLRMNRNSSLTAAEIVNRYTSHELADIFYQLGGEKNSRKIARAIETARLENKITTTLELVEVIKKVTNPRYLNKTLSRVFQGLRLVVNDEMDQLQKGMEAAFSILETGGRIVVIAYHSLEDRLVKLFFREHSKGSGAEGRLLTKKPLMPSSKEVAVNSRARSARMRVLEKI